MALGLRIFEAAFLDGRILKEELSPINVMCKINFYIEVNEVDF